MLGAAGGLIGAGLIGGAITFLAQAVLAGVLTVVVSRAVLGERITLGEAWTQLRPRLLRLLVLSVLVFFASAAGRWSSASCRGSSSTRCGGWRDRP